MPSKRKKHQYLMSGGKVPRRTLYRMRKASEKVQTSQLLNNLELESKSSESTDDDCGNTDTILTCDSEDWAGPQLLTTGAHENSVCSDDETQNNPHFSSPPEESINCDYLPSNVVIYNNYNLLHNQDEGSQSEDSEPNNEAQPPTAEDGFEEENNCEEHGEYEEEDAPITFERDLNHMPNVAIDSCVDGKDEKDPLLSNPLCPCSPSTAGDALLYCLALGIRHSLSWAAMVDILKMVNLLYGYEAVSATKYYLQKLFYKQRTAKYHLYCSLCETYLGVKGEEGVESSCECSNNDETVEPSTSFFVSVDLAEQFRSLLQREELANEILTYRFQRNKLNEEAFEDMFDGEVYKNLCQDGQVLGNPYNFSYTFNTDGVQMGKSSKNAAWPIFISVTELSPKNRKKHMIYAGVWVGKTQPNMRIFLKPFVDEANKLSEEGFYWTDSENNIRHSKAYPLCCIVDSAARYKLLNLISYNGYFGCTFCYQQAENTSKGRRFTILKNEAPLRTHQSMIKDMNEVYRQRNNPDKKKRIVKGCKGYTPLALLKYFSLDTSFVVDSMHNSYLGSSKSHTGLLLTTCRTEYYIGSPDKIAILDARLCIIRTPSTVTRPPRSIEEWKMWKASEWRSWLLCYSLVCLNGLVPKKYVHHLALFSTALHILLQKSITFSEVQLANQYLRKYVYLTETYFGKTAMVYNYHLLLHICRGVVNFGPLWTHNAFQFEGENHYFMQMRTSPGHVVEQLVRRYSIFSQFPKLCELYASSEKPLGFLNEITGKSLKSFTKVDGCMLIGNGRPLPDDCVDNCVKSMVTQHQDAHFVSFEKILFKGVRYSTGRYAEGKLQDDSYISLGPNIKARIENIVQIKPDFGQATVVLVVKPFTVRLPDFLKTNLVNVVHVKEIVKTCDAVAIKPNMISGQCIYVEFDNREFVTDIPYGCYGD